MEPLRPRTDHRLKTMQRDELGPSDLAHLLRWLEAAYGDPAGSWRHEHWDDLGEGPHVMLEDERGELLAHACIAWVPTRIEDVTLTAGYLEDVATRPDRRGEGLGSSVVEAARPLIEAGGDLGLLATGSHGFYERLGWVRWTGPSFVTETDGSRTPTPEEDGAIMALFLATTPEMITRELPITRPRRDPEEAW